MWEVVREKSDCGRKLILASAPTKAGANKIATACRKRLRKHGYGRQVKITVRPKKGKSKRKNPVDPLIAAATATGLAYNLSVSRELRNLRKKKTRENPLRQMLMEGAASAAGYMIGQGIGTKVVDSFKGKNLKKNLFDDKKRRKNPAVSAAQRRLFGAALAYKRGEKTKVSGAAKRIANSMSERKIRDFATGKQETRESRLMKDVSKSSREMDRTWAERLKQLPYGSLSQRSDADQRKALEAGVIDEDGSLTRIAKRRGYESPLKFARLVMKNWRAGKKAVLNKKTGKQSRVTKELMYKALFAVDMNKGRRANPTLLVARNPTRGSLRSKFDKNSKGFKDAMKMYDEFFEGDEPAEVVEVDVPPGTPKYLVSLGRAPDVSYKPPDHVKKKGIPFLHEWDKPPLLVTDATGKYLGYVDGDWEITGRGIEG
jgi:hypothetical protein